MVRRYPQYPVGDLKVCYVLYSLSYKNTDKDLQLLNDKEESQIVEDLKNIVPIYKYIINLSSDYNVNIIDDKVDVW
jgi:hypothetical protein